MGEYAKENLTLTIKNNKNVRYRLLNSVIITIFFSHL